jgi:hypothetical protein
MLFSGATYPPRSRDPGYWGPPPMLFWAVRSSCGGRLGWEVFRPKLARVRGRSCVSLGSFLVGLAIARPSPGLRAWHRRIVASGRGGRVGELSNRGTSFPRLKEGLPLSGEPPVRSWFISGASVNNAALTPFWCPSAEKRVGARGVRAPPRLAIPATLPFCHPPHDLHVSGLPFRW